ncbi:MAG: prepilin-type N-terminal cleavage/methylation domain-containing protein [Candidatus Taylorbacteria bacterium]|nr:prepilin-type N-terminal cleavage/methylation domain-containing protein [Candidatus Taylorbacteria bacterium]
MKHLVYRKKGFTLIELLIVIGIIGILAAVTMASLNDARLKADDSKRNQDLQQVKTALELYAEKNQYVLPVLAQTEGVSLAQTFPTISSFLATVAYADVNHTDPACIKFDQLAAMLVTAGYLPQAPRDPKDDPSEHCYKAASVDIDGDTGTAEAIVGYAYLSEKYTTATDGVYGNKKTGFIVTGKTEVSPTIMAAACTTTGEYPVFDLSSTSSLCTRNPGDVVADKVLGVTNGEEYTSGSVTPSDTSSESPSDVPSDTSSSFTPYCSNPTYTNQTDCEMNRSYCSNSSYTDEWNCTNNGSYSGGYCSNSSYTNESDCVNNGSYSGGYCSASGYSSESECTGAGYYTSPGYCSSGGYSSESECTGAQCMISSAYCSNSSYSDQYGCTSATCSTGSAYCSDSSYYNQYDCENNGYTWYSEQYGSCGYTWYPDQYGSCGYTWYPPSGWMSYGYTWYPGTYTANTWYSGTYTPYTWNNIPGSTWYSNP